MVRDSPGSDLPLPSPCSDRSPFIGPVDFLSILNLYAIAIPSRVARKEFRYADFVASRMNEVFVG